MGIKKIDRLNLLKNSEIQYFKNLNQINQLMVIKKFNRLNLLKNSEIQNFKNLNQLNQLMYVKRKMCTKFYNTPSQSVLEMYSNKTYNNQID